MEDRYKANDPFALAGDVEERRRGCDGITSASIGGISSMVSVSVRKAGVWCGRAWWRRRRPR